MVAARTSREQLVQRDLAKIARRWQLYRAAVPNADPIFFVFQIAATGKLPAMPAKRY
jgi:hypothetical protein